MGTIADKLVYLDGTKAALRQAINDAGGYLTVDDRFRSYAGKWLREKSATLSLDFWCERFITRRQGSLAPFAIGPGIVNFARSTAGGRFNEYGLYVNAAIDAWRLDHDPASLTTSSSTVSFDSSVASFELPSGHAFFVGDLFRATAIAGSLWGVVMARSATSVVVHVRNSNNTGSANSWTCIKPLGLLIEEARTNLLLRSADMSVAPWGTSVGTCATTPAAAVAPDGTMTATLLEFSGANSNRFQSGAMTIGSPHTFSIWLKSPPGMGTQTCRIGSIATAVFSTVTVTEAWQRFSVTQTPTATPRFPMVESPSGTNKLLAWGAQLEAGAFPTSYIPTEASQVTRAADVASVNTVTPWYNASEGTLFVESYGAKGAGIQLALLGGASWHMFYDNGNTRTGVFRGAGAAFVPSVPAGLIKQATTYSPTVILNATAGRLSSAFSVGMDYSAVASLSIGRSQFNGFNNGHIRSLRHWPKRDMPIQEMTA